MTNTARNEQRFMPVAVFGFFVFAINFSGDHVFYKTNTLNLVLFFVAIVILTACWMFRMRKLNVGNIRHELNLLLVLITLTIVATVPGYLLNGSHYRYFSTHEYVLHLCSLLWVFYILHSFENDKSVESLGLWFAVLTLYLFVVSVLQVLGVQPLIRLGINFFDRQWTGGIIPYNGFDHRVAATAGNPNYLAGVLIQLSPVLLSLFFTSFLHRGKRFSLQLSLFAVAFSLSMVTLVLTGSRAGFIASALSMLVFCMLGVFITRGKISSTAFAAVPLVIGVLIVFLVTLNNEFADRLLAVGSDSSSITRLSIWKAALNSIFEHPILGYGLGSSYALVFSFADPDIQLMHINSFVHAHNDLLEVWQEGGLLGLLAYLALWASSFLLGWCVIKNKYEPMTRRMLTLGVVCGLLAIHIQGLFSVAPRMVVVKVITSTLLACLFFLARGYLTNKLRSLSTILCHRLTWIVLIGLLSVSIVWVYSFARGQFSLTNAIASAGSDPLQMVELALNENVSDPYLLERAIDIAQDNKDYATALAFAYRVRRELAHFRDVDAETSHSLLQLGQHESALDEALRAYHRNRFSIQNLQVLYFLSLKNEQMEDSSAYLADIIRYRLCRSALKDCEPLVAQMDSEVAMLAISSAGTSKTLLVSPSFMTDYRAQFITQPKQTDVRLWLTQAIANALISSRTRIDLLQPEQRNQVRMALATAKNLDQFNQELESLSVYSGRGFIADYRQYQAKKADLNRRITALESDLTGHLKRLPVSFDFEEFRAVRDVILMISADLTPDYLFNGILDLYQLE
ncbi:O-antigen ligase family protein [Reinekea sp. G2M2-21]|uniref:O-antigen ligase family protein n=1 Tax=Reinekea sp. G2M2-21 TaxID=2788942 RepID=UPI0018A9C227